MVRTPGDLNTFANNGHVQRLGCKEDLGGVRKSIQLY